MRRKIAIVTEYPLSFKQSWDAFDLLIAPIQELCDYDPDLFSVLQTESRSSKGAPTKAEIRDSLVKDELLPYNIILTIGAAAFTAVTGLTGLNKARGKPITLGHQIILPTVNPSILRHDPAMEQVIDKDRDLFLDIIEFGGIPEEKELNIRVVRNWIDLGELIEDLRGSVSYDIETNSLNPFQKWVLNSKGEKEVKPAKIVSIGFGTRRYQWIVITDPELSPFSPKDLDYVVLKALQKLKDCFIIMHNGKFDSLWTWVHFGIKLRIDFDTMLAHYLLNENSRHGLKYLAQKYLGAPDWEVDLNTKQGAGSVDKLAKYHAHDLYYTRQLKFFLSKLLSDEPSVDRVFRRLMMPVANLFVEIEYDGVYVNKDQFEEAESVLRELYDSALSSLKQWEPPQKRDSRGRYVDFNWGSTKQLGELLFKHLKLPVIEKTATGNASCSESVIKRLNHPCTQALLQFREAKQQLSFFIDGWKPFLHRREDGHYLHPSFKLHGTVTGRLSCENPNLQQVPRDPRIRSLLSAPKGWVLVEWDLSQIELRVAAELADEANMIHAFVNNIDIHWRTALREIARGGGMKDLVIDTAYRLNQTRLGYSESIDALLKAGPDVVCELEPKWKEIRKKAKAINFGYLYGMWWKKFKDYARDNYGLTITDQEAEASRDFFFDDYPSLDPWHRRQKKFAMSHGYVSSLTGRRRRLPDATGREKSSERDSALRQAINSPVQSFANDLNLMAALQLRSEFGRSVVKICGTVHDAVLARVRADMVPTVFPRMLEIMRRPKLMDEFEIYMNVPIEAEGKIGPWGKGQSYEKWRKANGL